MFIQATIYIYIYTYKISRPYRTSLKSCTDPNSLQPHCRQYVGDLDRLLSEERTLEEGAGLSLGPSEDNPDPRVESPFWGVPGLRCLPCEERASTSFLRPLSWLCILGGFWAGSPGLSFSVAWECLPGVSFSGDSEVPPEPSFLGLLSWLSMQGGFLAGSSCTAVPVVSFSRGYGHCASSTVLSYPKDPKDSQLPPVITAELGGTTTLPGTASMELCRTRAGAPQIYQSNAQNRATPCILHDLICAWQLGFIYIKTLVLKLA